MDGSRPECQLLSWLRLPGSIQSPLGDTTTAFSRIKIVRLTL